MSRHGNVIDFPASRARFKVSFGEWIHQMDQVKRHLNEVKEKNGPAIAFNRELLRVTRLDGKKPRLHPMPFRVASWAKAFLRREAQVSRHLKTKPPEQWEKEVGNLMPPVRNRVACLVWWDYFGGRLVSEAWPHLNKYMDCPYVEVPDKQVIRGLHQVGYSPSEATRRAAGGEGAQDED